MTRNQIERLATYNSEVERGIVHTPEYDERMKYLQELFDNERQEARSWQNAIE